MASQIAHIVYADQYLKKFPSIANKDEFYLGVCFPDIRRVSNLTREQTHQHFKNLDLYFKNLSSFEAGWKFHVWCDLRRNELLRDYKLWDIKVISQVSFFAYYFLEDQLVWNKHKNWETICNIYHNPVYIKLFKQLNRQDWNFWFKIVGDYIANPPTAESIRKFCKLQPALATKADSLVEEVERLKQDQKVMEIFGRLYGEMV